MLHIHTEFSISPMGNILKLFLLEKSGQTLPFLEMIYWKKVDKRRHFQKKEKLSLEKKMYFAILY